MPVRRSVALFSGDLRKAAKALEIGTLDAVERFTLGVLRGAVLRTPIDRGTLAANWQLTRGTPLRVPNEELAATSKAHARVMAEERAAAVSFDDFDSWTIGNYMPYAQRVEFEGWSHTKAPLGMLRLAVTEETTKFLRVAERALARRGL